MELKELVKQAYYSEKNGMLLIGDCIEWMKKIPDQSVDMILADLPYGTTACKWDSVIPFDLLWEQYERIIKNNGAIVLTASQPFTSLLITSNLKLFRYSIIWKKERPTNFMFAKKGIMKYHEDIVIFYKNQPFYNPQMIRRKEQNKRNNKPRGLENKVWNIEKNNKYAERTLTGNNDFVYPNSILEFSMERGMHPTQKPVALFEYLIKTYTQENEIVLDNVAGSCTTAIASKNTNRRWICIEKEQKYCDISVDRIKNHKIS